MSTIDLNCDLGESYGSRPAVEKDDIYQYISSANIACGFHSGDPLAIEMAFLRAKARGVAAGAHPSFPDLSGFGRRMMELPPDELRACLRYQMAAAAGMGTTLGQPLSHVKAHGALYHLLWRDEPAAQVFVDLVAEFDRELRIYGPPESALQTVCFRAGLPFRAEAFADRQYEDDLSLRPRSVSGALLDPEQAAKQAVEVVLRQRVKTASGSWRHLHAETLCIHGDQPQSVLTARLIHQQLTGHGVEIAFH